MNLKDVWEGLGKEMGKLQRTLVLISAVGMLTSIPLKVSLTKTRNELNDFYRTYDITLAKYGDVDKDGFISSDEKLRFNYDFLIGKEVTYCGESDARDGRTPLAFYPNGEEVNRTQLTEWLKEYTPNK